MTNASLAYAYLVKARRRLKILPVLEAEEAYSDVVREAQEIVELATKGMLRAIGVEPPKWYDVGSLLLEYQERLPLEVAPLVPELVTLSRRLWKERELSFYGDIDFIPTEAYTREDASQAIRDAHLAVDAAAATIPLPEEPARP